MPGKVYRKRHVVMSRNDWVIAFGMALPLAAGAFFALVWWMFA